MWGGMSRYQPLLPHRTRGKEMRPSPKAPDRPSSRTRATSARSQPLGARSTAGGHCTGARLESASVAVSSYLTEPQRSLAVITLDVFSYKKKVFSMLLMLKARL